jgi:hypothetical protein
VGGFNKIADKFVDDFLTKEGESVEEAKTRLAAEQRAIVAGIGGIVLLLCLIPFIKGLK